MADAFKIWNGGAAATAQIDTIVFASGTWTGDGNITTTMTAEDGTTTQTVVTATTNANGETQRDAHLANLQASTQSLFTAVTWASSGTDTITGTAVVPGVPFYSATTETDTIASGISSDTTTTSNSGPNDFNTAANWDPSGVPGADDKVKFVKDGYDLLYGLDQNGTDLQHLRISADYTGQIGQPQNSYYLKIDVSNVSTASTAYTVINASRPVWLLGSHDNLYIAGTANGTDAVAIGTGSTVSSVYIQGVAVAGRITFANSCTMNTLYMMDCPGAALDIGTSNHGLSAVVMGSGTAEIRSVLGASGTFDLFGGVCTFTDEDDWDQTTNVITVYGGTMKLEGGSESAKNISSLLIYGGNVDLSGNKSDGLTIASTAIWGGTLNDRGAQANITYTNDIVVHGGRVTTDTGSTIAVSF